MTRFVAGLHGLSRRSFLSGLSASVLAAPAVAQVSGDVEVAIIGAGAAGIAAARSMASAGRSFVLLEASPRIGGRARSVSAFDQPFDLGAWSFSRLDGTLAETVERAGLPLVPVSSATRLFVDGREASESAYDAFSATLGAFRRDMLAGVDGGRDGPAGAYLGERGSWSATVGALMGPLGCGRPLATVSALDLSLREPAFGDVTCPLGLGDMFERLGAWQNLRTNAPVTGITNAGRFYSIAIAGQKVPLRARVVVLAVPPSVLALEAIRFNPRLPARLLAALKGCPAGAIEQVAFVLPGNPLQLANNETVLAQVGAGTPALLKGRLNGGDLHVLRFGGEAARRISKDGATAGLELVRSTMQAAFGLSPGIIDKVATSGWTGDPLIGGAMVVAAPGQGAQRRVFGDPLGRIILAGEYTSPTGWGTLTGAWNSGELAAARAFRLLDGPA